jgi:hypothetical protein
MFFVNKNTVFPILLMALGMSTVWGGVRPPVPSSFLAKHKRTNRLPNPAFSAVAGDF